MLDLQFLGEEVIVDPRWKNTLQSIDAVLGIYELPGVVVERLEDMIIREVQLLRGQKVVVIEDDVVQVPLIVRSLVEDDEGAFLEMLLT